MNAVRRGKTCLLSSMSNVMHGRGAPVGEELIFLLGRGNRIDYRLRETQGEPAIYLGHHSLEIVARFCEFFGAAHAFVEGPSADLLGELRAALSCGSPVLIWVDMASLPYLAVRPPPGAIHAVTVVGECDGVLSIEDCYAPLGLYSEKVATHTLKVPLGEFTAWRLAGYSRHRIDFARLQKAVGRPAPELIAQGLAWACQDFLQGANGVPPAAAVLDCVAADLAVLHGRYPGSSHPQVYTALAYDLRYFGILWSREFIAAAMCELGLAAGSHLLPELAQQLRECARRWKLVMLGLLKLPLSKTPDRQVDLLQQKIREIVGTERQLYLSIELDALKTAGVSYA